MPEIVLYELKRTRAEKCRWALKEADLSYRSEGNSPRILGSDELKRIHPLGKLPAALIDGKPLFEASAIVNAVVDLVPEKELIPLPGTWDRHLHDQWTLFIATEVEAWAWSGFLNKSAFLLPKADRRAEVYEQSAGFFRKGVSVLEDRLGQMPYMLGARFGAIDIIASLTLMMGRAAGYMDGAGFPNVMAYLDRLAEREHCPFKAVSFTD